MFHIVYILGWNSLVLSGIVVSSLLISFCILFFTNVFIEEVFKVYLINKWSNKKITTAICIVTGIIILFLFVECPFFIVLKNSYEASSVDLNYFLYNALDIIELPEKVKLKIPTGEIKVIVDEVFNNKPTSSGFPWYKFIKSILLVTTIVVVAIVLSNQRDY